MFMLMVMFCKVQGHKKKKMLVRVDIWNMCSVVDMIMKQL